MKIIGVTVSGYNLIREQQTGGVIILDEDKTAYDAARTPGSILTREELMEAANAYGQFLVKHEGDPMYAGMGFEMKKNLSTIELSFVPIEEIQFI